MQRLHSDTDVKAGVKGWGYIYGKVSTMALCSLTLRSLANSNPSQKQSNCRCSMGMLFTALIVSMQIGVMGFTYTCGLLRCSFRLGWAMRDARSVERVTGTATHTFFICTERFKYNKWTKITKFQEFF